MIQPGEGLSGADPIDFEKLRQEVARIIYDSWDGVPPGWVPWQERGNSLRQTEALRLAKALLLLARANATEGH